VVSVLPTNSRHILEVSTVKEYFSHKSITKFPLLDGVKMLNQVKNIGSEETHGEPTGERMDSSR